MTPRILLPPLLLSLLVLPRPGRAEDLVELLSGAKVRGKIKSIRKEDKEFDFEVQIGSRMLTRVYPFDKVHAVTMSGKRYVLNEESTAATPRAGSGTSDALRTRGEIKQLIDDVGSTPPPWYESTPLDHPASLDLSWPEKPEGNWNNQKNVGQYIWDIINPNPDRWRGGIRLLHHITSLHRDDPALLKRDMESLGNMYFRLFQDYPRSAFWLERARVEKGTPPAVMLAECYWRLGNKQMAEEMLSARRLPLHAIKLLGDMGETEKALRLANSFGSAGVQPHEAYLLAGDACRLAGRYDRAIGFYEQVLATEQARNEDYEQRYKARARESIRAIRLFDQADVSRVADGTYTGSSTGYNATLEVQVVVAGGRLESVKVSRHEEKQFYSALTDTTAQILQKQSVKEIDATSQATITSQAIVNAAAEALAKGAD